MLYAQHIDYLGLDIDEINLFNGCLTGIITNIYDYDRDRRLIKTDNKIKKGFREHLDAYKEVYTYSPGGNILSLERNGIIGRDFNEEPVISKIDNMQYSYNSSYQLESVADGRPGSFGFMGGSTAYSYDARGNMTTAAAKNGYGILYNPLNLPYRISGSTGIDEMWYTQSAEKFRICQGNGSSNDVCRIYLRNLELEWYDGEYIPKAYHHGDGKMMFHFETQSDIKERIHLHYYLKDHLGNIMVTFDDRNYDGMIDPLATGTMSEVIGRQHYYSFGMQWSNAWEGTEAAGYWQQRFRYNGKELHKGSRLLDYGFRYYSAEIGRFTGVDPLAEKYLNMSPYGFVANNPINNREIDGRYFEKGSKSERTANRIEKQANKQADKLESKAEKLINKGKGTGDLCDRVDQLRQSADDIVEMRNNTEVEFKYASLSANKGNPEIKGLSTNVVTMYVGSDMESRLHESRHGGDAARGNLTKENYNINHEVSAYKAQYSWGGNYSYRPANYFANEDKIKVFFGAFQSQGEVVIPQIMITNINQINANMVRNIGEEGKSGRDRTWKPIYK